MDYNKAQELIDDLLFDFVFVNRRILRNSRVSTGRILKEEMYEYINGLGIVKKEEGYGIVFYTEHPMLSKSQIEYFLGLERGDIIVDNIGPIQIQSEGLMCGYSLGHYEVSGGTLGGYVRDDDGVIYLLSNNHVIANFNKGTIGDPVLHPCKNHGGWVPGSTVGTLSNFKELKFKTGINKVDCGIARSLNQKINQNELPLVGVIQGVQEPDFGMEVIKFGQSSNLTVGIIDALEVSIRVDYRGASVFRNIAEFRSQFSVKSTIPGTVFSKVGDSGSLIVDSQTKRTVGLLFAGSDTGVTFANPISSVLETLSVTIL